MVTFTAIPTNAGSSPKYQWQVNGANKGTGTAAYTDTFVNGDRVTCTLTSSTSCNTPVTSAPVTMQVNSLPGIAFGSGNLVINNGKSIQLMPVITGNIATYTWTPATGLNNSAIAWPVANPSQTTTYKLHVIATTGCDAESSVTITVVDHIDINSVFTPNNDGINDTWQIPALAFFPKCSVDVYNRNGAVIFHSVGYAQAWDGTYNRSPLPEGTYYYVIDLKTKPVLSGAVTIIR